MVGNELARAVRIEVILHVIFLLLHLFAHFVKGRRRNEAARTVDLPRDGRVARAHVIVTGGPRSGAGVLGNVDVLIHDHSVKQVLSVREVIAFVVDNREGLRLHANLLVGVERSENVDNAVVAEHAIVERRLVLPLSTARAGGGVRPMHLVGLTNHHVRAMLPVVRLREFWISRVEVVAAESEARALSRELTVATALILMAVAIGQVDTVVRHGASAVLIVLTNREVLGAEMPVHVHRAKVGLIVRLSDWHAPLPGIEATNISTGHISASLLEDRDNAVHHAGNIQEVVVARPGVRWLLAGARVHIGVRTGLRSERVVGGADNDRGDHTNDNTNKQTAERLDRALRDGFGGSLLTIHCRGEDKLDNEDEKRGSVSDVSDVEGPVVVEVLRELDRRHERVVTRPRRLNDTDGEAANDQEADGKNQPDEAGEELDYLAAQGALGHAKEGEAVEDDHNGGDHFGNEAKGHGGLPGRLEVVAGEEVNRVLQTVGGDHARDRRNDLVQAELVDVLLQGCTGTSLRPRVARGVVMEANAVGWAEELVGAIVEAMLNEAGVSEARQVRWMLELHNR
mmetsp:Transcript_16077/g.20385  ORF Transcript_16077/g.20385 Transcript_16077/m.20385 type:complete len:569 (+) Transcript_16077:443-2149(+)